jgi:hypothetical protein
VDIQGLARDLLLDNIDLSKYAAARAPSVPLACNPCASLSLSVCVC